MKTRFLIIIGIVLVSVVMVISVYVISVQNRCETILGDTHYPRPFTLWNCLDYLHMVDNPPPKSSTVIPEPEPEPVPMKCKSGPAPSDKYYFNEDTCDWEEIENEN